MKRLSAATIVLLAFWLPAGTTRAQTLPITPPAFILLPGSLLATTLHGSAHLVGTAGVGQNGTTAVQIATFSGDAAWGLDPRSKLHATVAGIPTLSTLDLAWKGRYLATATDGKWSCTDLLQTAAKGSRPATKPTSTATASQIPGVSLGPLPKLGKPVDLGEETVNGTPVWHIQSKSVASAKEGQLTLDVYVARSDLTLNRLTVSNTVTIQNLPIPVVSTVDFSQYGEAVSVTLPPACTSTRKQPHTSALLQPVLRALESIMNPLRILSQLISGR